MKFLKWLMIIASIVAALFTIILSVPQIFAKLGEWFKWDPIKVTNVMTIATEVATAAIFTVIGLTTMAIPLIGWPVLAIAGFYWYGVVKRFMKPANGGS